MKTNVERIRFYTRKAAQFSTIPIAQRRPGSLRFRRLMAYKAALNKRIEEDGIRV